MLTSHFTLDSLINVLIYSYPTLKRAYCYFLAFTQHVPKSFILLSHRQCSGWGSHKFNNPISFMY